MNNEPSSEYYDKISSGYEELHSEEQKLKLLTIQKHIKVQGSEKVLDIGGGTGILCDFIKANITNLEPSKEMLKQGLNKKRQFTPINDCAENIQFLFRDNEFDKIFCITAAHHFNDVDSVLLGMQKVSKKDADIVISLLKRAPSTIDLVKKIKNIFDLHNQVECEKDIILFFRNKKQVVSSEIREIHKQRVETFLKAPSFTKKMPL